MMRLTVHMSPLQHRSGYPARIAALLRSGTFCALRGRWHVRRHLAAVGPDERRVTFELEPRDTVARAIEQA
jgi:hypothetical protein